MVRLYKYLQKQIARFGDDESGATMIEYSVLTGLITIGLIVTILAVSGQLVTIWGLLTAALATIPGV